MAATPAFPATINDGLVAIANADASNLKTLLTPGSNGTKVTAINLSSTDTSSRIIQVWITRSAVNYLLGSVTLPALAGNDGVTGTIPVLSSSLIPNLPVDNDGQAYLLLKNGDVLSISSTTTVTSAKNVFGYAVGADF